MNHRLILPVALALIASFVAGGCAPDLKVVKRTLDADTTVGVAYRGSTIALLDTSFEGRLGLGPKIDVPEAYQAVGRAVRDTLRARASGARIDLVDPQSEVARAASDVHIQIEVDGAYLCQGGFLMRQTCTLSMQARMSVEDRRTGAVTPLDYRISRRSPEIPGSENWEAISLDQARRAVPPSSLAGPLADEIRRDLNALLNAAEG